MANIETRQAELTLNDGRKMPQLGLGTYDLDEATESVRDAVRMGYRLIDTATIYGKEAEVGAALDTVDPVFLTTKVWNTEQGEGKTRAAVDTSLAKLRRDTVDLLLIHWPCPDNGLYLETWKTLVALREEGKARSIGVSNFMPDHLKSISDATGVTPAVNQVQCHPYFQSADVISANVEHGVITQCWSPLGHGEALTDPTLQSIADAHDASVASVILAWQLARGWSTVPKASSSGHRKGNLAALDLSLSQEDVAAIDALDKGEEGRMGPHPNSFS